MHLSLLPSQRPHLCPLSRLLHPGRVERATRVAVAEALGLSRLLLDQIVGREVTDLTHHRTRALLGWRRPRRPGLTKRAHGEVLAHVAGSEHGVGRLALIGAPTLAWPHPPRLL